MNDWQKQFDEEFVKDLGPKVEPVWIDPNGSVGPVKAFIQQTLDSQAREMLDDLKEYYPDHPNPAVKTNSQWVREKLKAKWLSH